MDIVHKYITGETDPFESAAAESWIAASEENKGYAGAVRQIWEETKKLQFNGELDTALAWQKLHNRIANQKQHSFFYSKIVWLKAAAALLVIIGSVLMVYYFSSRKINKDLLHQADGTTVVLGVHSGIFYNNDRDVSLKGSAFFTVKHDSIRPFTVHINGLIIKDLGTAFFIGSSNDSTTITVSAGRVQVSKAGQSVELSAGEKIIVQVKDTALRKQGTIKTDTIIKTVINKTLHKAVMQTILQEIIERHIADTIQSAGLSDAELIVNGIKQQVEIQKAFKEKYLDSKVEGYYYGPVKMIGKGYFYDKKDFK